MIDLWARITNELNLAAYKETDIHPHVDDEHSDRFHSSDSGSTEWEYLNLLYALVVAIKPVNILETGTAMGYGTLALAAAVRANGFGNVTTVDTDSCTTAKELLQRFDLEREAPYVPDIPRARTVHFVQQTGLEFCARVHNNIDFAFFDSDVSCRHHECATLIRRGKLKGIATFHDASPLRYSHGSNFEMVNWIESRGGILFPLSRGFAMLKV